MGFSKRHMAALGVGWLLLLAAGCDYLTEQKTIYVVEGSSAALVLDVNSLSVPEGSSGRIAMRLSDAPARDVVVNVALTDAAGALAVSSGATLTFTPANWSTNQFVVVQAQPDADVTSQATTLEIRVDGALVAGLDVKELDSGPSVTEDPAPDPAPDPTPEPTPDPAPPPSPTVEPPPLPPVDPGQPQPGVVITIKDVSGQGAQDYPATAVVPLIYGKFQDTKSFRLVDGQGTAVPAQFEVVNRWWLRDGSIRHVAVHFKASVGPNSKAYYTFQSDGAGPTPAEGVQVTETSDLITVNTGPLKFTVRKQGFNLFDEVWLDRNGDRSFAASEQIIAKGSSQGPVFTGRLPGDVQRDSDRTDVRVEVEEAGPMRAVIRLSAVTLLHSTEDHVHGWAVRIYAYAGDPAVKVDYQLQNSPINITRKWPLYFEDVSLKLKPSLQSPTLRLAPGPGNVWSGDVSGGHYLLQNSDRVSAVYTSAGSALRSGSNEAGQSSFGWADLSDAQGGVFVAIRNMAEMWPNAVEVESDGTLDVRLWPKQSAMLYSGQVSSTGLYWLDDMRHVVKEVLFQFHGPDASSEDLSRAAQNFQYHPVPFIDPAAYYVSRCSLDLDGILPAPDKLSLQDSRRISYPASRLEEYGEKYNFGWDNFGGNIERKRPSAGGNWPYSASELFGGAERVGEWIFWESKMWGEINCRPEWLAEYNYERDYTKHYPTTGSPIETWRAKDNELVDSSPLAPHLAGTGWDGWFPMDDAHLWTYHVEQFYYVSYNLWVKDWYKFIGEFRKGQRTLDPVPAGIYPGRLTANGFYEPRDEAHAISQTMQAFRVTGDPTVWKQLMVRFVKSVEGQRALQYGIWNVDGESSFQIGFLARAFIGLWTEIGDSDPDLKARIFQLLWGIMEWNQELARYAYTYLDSSTTQPGDVKSAGSATQLCDAAAWFYLQTGITRYNDLLWQYIDDGINGGNPALGDLHNWVGDYMGRVTGYVLKHPWTPQPPAAIQDLKATTSGGTVTLEWTTPSRAARFHVIWSTLPISATYDRSPGVRNVWACTPVGNRLEGKPGQRQSLQFNAPAGQRIYAAVFSFDSENAMSGISNIIQIVP